MYSNLILILFITIVIELRSIAAVDTKVRLKEGNLTGDFFSDVDISNLGPETCLNIKELVTCIILCQKDIDCGFQDRLSVCDDECVGNCAYLEYFQGRKCVTRMIANIDWFRNFGLGTFGKVKRKPGWRNQPVMEKTIIVKPIIVGTKSAPALVFEASALDREAPDLVVLAPGDV